MRDASGDHDTLVRYLSYPKAFSLTYTVCSVAMSYIPSWIFSDSMPAIGYFMFLRLPVLVVMSRRGKEVTRLSSFL